jgi:hypothetical protein
VKLPPPLFANALAEGGRGVSVSWMMEGNTGIARTPAYGDNDGCICCCCCSVFAGMARLEGEAWEGRGAVGGCGMRVSAGVGEPEEIGGRAGMDARTVRGELEPGGV